MEKRDIRRHCSSTQEIIRKSEKDRVSIEKNIYYKKSQRKYYVVFYYGVDPETKKPIKRKKHIHQKGKPLPPVTHLNERSGRTW